MNNMNQQQSLNPHHAMIIPTNPMPRFICTPLHLASKMTFEGHHQSSLLTNPNNNLWSETQFEREKNKVMVQQEMSQKIKTTVIPMKLTTERLQQK